MTENKPIMIDGVDVSGCVHYKNNGKCRIPHYQQSIKYTCCNCNEWDCYFKQLDQLKAENEKYQLFIEKLCDYAGLECDSEEQAIRTLLDFAGQMYKAKVINDQLKVSKEQAEQKLERIRELIKKDYCFEIKSCEFCANIGDCLNRQILQIIDEVE